jgi:hypothetical protein
MYANERNDIIEVLALAKPNEAIYVRSMLRAGRIDGGSYVSQKNGQSCGCLLGTLYTKRVGLEKASQVYRDSGYACNDYIEQKLAIPKRRTGSLRPAEVAFMSIALGSTPQTSSYAEQIDNTITELMLSNPSHFGRVGK